MRAFREAGTGEAVIEMLVAPTFLILGKAYPFVTVMASRCPTVDQSVGVACMVIQWIFVVYDGALFGAIGLEIEVADPKSPQKHVWRARIVLLSGACVGTSSIMAKTGKSKTCVWRWQERF
ncbi:MAG: hypothetical protein P8N43_11195, partial [Alphaproteobacteria bacterium]|nr:hypothetical protein [Alphaproteobacteria bacterium]